MPDPTIPTVEDHAIELFGAVAEAADTGAQLTVLFATLVRARDRAFAAAVREACAKHIESRSYHGWQLHTELRALDLDALLDLED